jgi:hypothetical protein
MGVRSTKEQTGLTLLCSPDGGGAQSRFVRLTDGQSSCFLRLL